LGSAGIPFSFGAVSASPFVLVIADDVFITVQLSLFVASKIFRGFDTSNFLN
jgi:hypothetical protein